MSLLLIAFCMKVSGRQCYNVCVCVCKGCKGYVKPKFRISVPCLVAGSSSDTTFFFGVCTT